MISTILGASGFIGRHLASRLRGSGKDCWLPKRNDPHILTRPLGRVYYCIGLTADFRSRPFETVDAHVGVLRQLLEHADFAQLLYLSSTRVYAGIATAEESETLAVAPYRADDLYNLSKLMGECLALSSNRNCQVARLSNVLGPGMEPTNFIGSVLEDARQSGRVHLQTSLSSEKDYIWIDDAIEGILAIAEHGKPVIYNLAGGVNIRHATITNLLEERGVRVSVADDAPVTCFPTISIDRLALDTGYRPAPVLPRLSKWLDELIVQRQ